MDLGGFTAGDDGAAAGLAHLEAEGGSMRGLPAGGTLSDGDGQMVPWQRVDGGAVALLGRALRPRETLRSTGAEAERAPVGLEAGLDRLRLLIDGRRFAAYHFLGGRRPYFWPLQSGAGDSVVRGQGTEEHPHHTGLNLAYGGHGEGGSTNIWSDWDEPNYGPGGRMVHVAWERLAAGPVGVEAIERLAYVDVEGDVFMTERRRLFIWRDAAGTRYVDWDVALSENRDGGARPLILAARLPAAMRVPGDGRVTLGGGQGEGRDATCAWVTAEGPAPSGGRHAIALLDHPENVGFPALANRLAVKAQVTLCHHAQPERPVGAPVRLRFRVAVHAGAPDPEVWWQAFARPAVLRADEGA